MKLFSLKLHLKLTNRVLYEFTPQYLSINRIDEPCKRDDED